jgi:hypothetical protein
MDNETYNELKEIHRKLKGNLISLEICLDQIGRKMYEVPFSGKFTERNFTLEDLISFGDSRYDVFKEPSRQLKSVYIRHTLFYLGKENGFSFNQMGIATAKSHATCLNAYQRAVDLLFVRDKDFCKIFDQVVEEFNKYLVGKYNEHMDPVTTGNKTDS